MERVLSAVPTLIASATVVMLRPASDGFEVLMMRRHAGLDVHGDAWVFPGGRVDANDMGPGNEIDVAARAAVREVAEEVGIGLDPTMLIPFAHWTTPVVFPKRFATWFFLGVVPEDATPLVDGVEAVAAEWLAPNAALALADRAGLRLAPPQFVTLTELARFASVDAARTAYRTRHPRWFTPRIVERADGSRATIYEGDVAYADTDPDLDRPGPRHRLVVVDGAWSYVHDA
jgi:8-oxo-dGTP pyrophosphatase MutT (NUDIX family)